MADETKATPPTDPEFERIEKNCGEPLSEEARRSIAASWKLLIPQITDLIDLARNAGKTEIKTAISEWMIRQIEEYRRKSRLFTTRLELRELRKLGFRAEALEEILSEIERL